MIRDSALNPLSPETCNESPRGTSTENRRKSQRRSVDAVIALQPVDEQGQPNGNLAIGRCRNLSNGGISLLCKRAITARYLELNSLTPGIGLAGTTIEVLRVDEFGNEFEVAGRFVTLPAD